MKELYLHDSYQKQCTATVTSVKDDKFIVLDQTVFYPRSGGQACDTGTITTNDTTYNVEFVGKFDGQVSHQVDKPGLKIGDKVECKINWEKRYKLMRSHTAIHLLSEVVHKETGALITGNNIDVDKVRMDFALQEWNPEQMKEYINKTNELLKQDLPIAVSFMSREEALKIPQVSKLAKGLPEHLKELRIVNIGDVDIQADGGTHVKSTKEVGTITFLKAESKGAKNRRLYFTVSDNPKE